MIIVDTSVWIDFFNGVDETYCDILADHLELGEVGILDIILTEILQGFSSDKDFQIATRLLYELPCFASLDKKLAIQAAQMNRDLRKKGITIRKTIDLIIASWCIENEFALLHHDNDFRQIRKVYPIVLIE